VCTKCNPPKSGIPGYAFCILYETPACICKVKSFDGVITVHVLSYTTRAWGEVTAPTRNNHVLGSRVS